MDMARRLLPIVPATWMPTVTASATTTLARARGAARARGKVVVITVAMEPAIARRA